MKEPSPRPATRRTEMKKQMALVVGAAAALLAVLMLCAKEAEAANGGQSLAQKMLTTSAHVIAKRPVDLAMRDFYASAVRGPLSKLKARKKQKRGLGRGVRKYIRQLVAIWTGELIWFTTGTTSFNDVFWMKFIADFNASTQASWRKLLVSPTNNCVKLLWSSILPVVNKYKKQLGKHLTKVLYEVLSDRETRLLGFWCSDARQELAKWKVKSGEAVRKTVKQVLAVNERLGAPTVAKKFRPLSKAEMAKEVEEPAGEEKKPPDHDDEPNSDDEADEDEEQETCCGGDH